MKWNLCKKINKKTWIQNHKLKAKFIQNFYKTKKSILRKKTLRYHLHQKVKRKQMDLKKLALLIISVVFDSISSNCRLVI